VEPGINLDPSVLDSGSGKAFRITTDARSPPTTSILRRRQELRSSATLLIPTVRLGNHYMAVTPIRRTRLWASAIPPSFRSSPPESATGDDQPEGAIKGGGFIVPAPAMQPQV